MTAFTRLLDIYHRAGFQVRTGLNPYQFDNHRDAPFTALYRDGQILPTGGGVAVQEIYFFETLFEEYHPKRIFVIGNAFGWSTLLLALLNPAARVVALDCGIEGAWAKAGIDLTNRIAAAEGLPARVVFGTSPQDVDSVVAEHLGSVDFAFIDGLHTNEQQEKDSDAVRKCASADCVYVAHDVINWHMLDGFERIAAKSPGMIARILIRTPSGIGVLSPVSLEPAIGSRLNAFCDPICANFGHSLNKAGKNPSAMGVRDVEDRKEPAAVEAQVSAPHYLTLARAI